MSKLSLFLFQDTELLTILILCLLAAIMILIVNHFLPEKEENAERAAKPALSFVTPSRPFPKYTKKDWFLIAFITIPYAIVSFWQLGSSVFPTTTWQPVDENGKQDIVLELPEETNFSAIYTIYGDADNSVNPDSLTGTTGMNISGSNDGDTWDALSTLPNSSIYEYNITAGEWNYRYIKITTASSLNTLTEIGFRNESCTGFLPVRVYQDAHADSVYPAVLVIDEQDKLKLSPTYMDQAYFDEIYHPRNAWEIANNHIMYATVHPLLGTNLIALSIKMFGMHPWAWRLPGVIAGILIVPLIYAIAKLLFQKRRMAAIAAVLCAGDFMHLTTSRIGTLEPFSVLFILCMFYFMIRYYYTSFFDTSFKKTLRLLFFSGIFMGIAIATKWTACYSAVGLAVILFSNLFRRMYEYFHAKQELNNLDELSSAQAHEALKIKDLFWKKFWITILCCVVFFLIIPAVIYFLSYLPDRVWKTDSWSIANVMKQNKYMYEYHINLKATHPYSSVWYQWIIDARPIWYSFTTDSEGIKHSISCFSNPLLTWGGLFAFVVTVYQMLRKRDKEAWVILIGYLSALIPWLLVTRCVFAYHFYPASCFMILAVVYLFTKIEHHTWGKWFIWIFLTAYIILFFAFLPATAGFGTTEPYIKAMEWFPSWYFG